MSIPTTTPTGVPFEFEINTDISTVVIISQNGNRHEYMLRCLRDLNMWLKSNCNGNWVYLGSRGEEENSNTGTVEEWARSNTNPVFGFYGTTQGRRGRFASYIPSILEYFQFVEVTHNENRNQVRAL